MQCRFHEQAELLTAPKPARQAAACSRIQQCNESPAFGDEHYWRREQRPASARCARQTPPFTSLRTLGFPHPVAERHERCDGSDRDLKTGDAVLLVDLD